MKIISNLIKKSIKLWNQKNSYHLPSLTSTVIPLTSELNILRVMLSRTKETVCNLKYKPSGHGERRVKTIFQHPDHRGMLATITPEVASIDGMGILECEPLGECGVRHWYDGGI